MIRVVVSGSGNMGAAMLAAIESQDDMDVVGVLEPRAGGQEQYSATSGTVYAMHADPATLFAFAHPDVVVDFTDASWTPGLIEAALANGVRPVIGTSNVPAEAIDALRDGCAQQALGGVYAANFAIGAVLMMHMAQIAARYFDAAELIELHHDQKVDSPSGTAMETARRMRAVRGDDFAHPGAAVEHTPGGRGAVVGGVGMHSVRLPGLVAHQEVIFGGPGQTLTIRHDSLGRDSFGPGVLLAVREVMRRDSLVEGLDALIGLG